MIPVLLYSIRQTTGTIASQGVKQVLLALIIMALLGYLLGAAMSARIEYGKPISNRIA
jgi:hypothetical protein